MAQNLLRQIERFIERHHMAPSRFGRDAVCDSRLVYDLRNGRELRLKSEMRVRAFMIGYEK